MRRNRGDLALGRKSGERRRPLRTCLSLEALERRELLSVDVSAVGEGRGVGSRGGDADTGVYDSYSARYTLTLTNHGAPEPVVLTSVLDPRLESVGVEAPDAHGHYTTSRDEAGVLTVSFTPLAGTVKVTIRGDVPLAPTDVPAPPLTYAYSVTTTEPNTNPQTSGSILVDAPYPFADASLAHQVSGSPIQKGGDVVYSFVATNNSTVATVPNARIVINLPAGWTHDKTGFSSGENPGWRTIETYPPYYDPFESPQPYLVGFSFNIGDLAPGESKTAPLTLHPMRPTGASPTLTFPAVLVTDSFEPDASNNIVNIATPFVPEARLSIKPTTTSEFPTPVGQNLTYRMPLSNQGPNPATGVVVRQALPAGMSFVSATARGEPVAGVVDDGTLTIALPDSKDVSIYDFFVTLSTAGMAEPATPTPISAPIQVTWNESPDVLSGVVDLGSVAPRGYVGSKLEASPSRMPVNGPLTFWYTLSNLNAFASSSLTAVLTFPPASVLGVPSAYDVERTPTSQIVTLHVPSLAAGETRKISIFTVPLAPGTKEFQVVANLTQDDRPERVYQPVIATAESVPTAFVGAKLAPDRRTAAITNYGPSPATGVEFSWGVGSGPVKQSLPVGNLDVGQTVVIDVGYIPPVLNGEETYTHTTKNERDPLPYGIIRGYEPYNFVTSLKTDVAAVETGGFATFTARTMNMGWVDVENAQLVAEIPVNSRLVSVSPGVVVAGDRLTLDIPHLAVGHEVGFWYVVSPTWDALAAGALTSEASVTTSRRFDIYDRSKISATIPVTAGPAGALVPGSPSYEAPENAGAIVVTVNRAGGASGPLSVNYATEAVDAAAGVDFRPVSGTLVFEDGETSKTITVPILDNPSSAVDSTVRLVFSNGQSTLLTIRDLDQGRAMPAVTDIQWVGPPRGIAAIQVELARPMPDPSLFDPSAFALATARPGLMRGARGGRPIPLRSLYDPATSTVVLTPRRPLPANLFYRLTVTGGGLTPGADYVAELARGRNLRYVSTTGDLVSLRLRGRGYIDALLVGPKHDERLSVVSLGPRQASVSRRVVQVHPRGFGPFRFQPPSRPTLARGWFAAAALRGSV